jgi:uncharacterized RDD family membrane protein YckC
VSLAPPPSVARRLACVIYDGLLVVAVVFAAAFPFVGLTRHLAPALAVPLTQAYVLLVVAGYFTLFWRKGQTLAMKTWGFELVSAAGGRVSWGQAGLRFLLACLNLVLLGLGWWAAYLDPGRQFLQDQLAGTRLVRSTPLK